MGNNGKKQILFKVVDNRMICDWIQGPHKCIEERGHNKPTYHACACGHTFTYDAGISITWIMNRIQAGESVSKSPKLRLA